MQRFTVYRESSAKMDKKSVRFYVETRVKLGDTPAKIYQDLRTVYGSDCVSHTTVYNYANECNGASSDTQESSIQETRGRPSTAVTDAIAHQIEDIVRENRHLSLRDIAVLVNVSHESVRKIMHEKLGRRYVCATWVPHDLSDHHKDLRVASAKSIRRTLCNLSSDERLRVYAVQDESWFFLSPLSKKSSNKSWVSKDEDRPRIVKQGISSKKTMLSLMFTGNKKFHIQTTGKGQNIDNQYFIEFLRKAGDKWRCLRSDPTRLCDIVLQFDNARPHCAAAVKEFLEKRSVTTIWQAPYSPDLNLCDRWAFNHLKKEMEGHTFDTANDVENMALHILKSTPSEVFQHQLNKLLDHCQLVIDCSGDYVI